MLWAYLLSIFIAAVIATQTVEYRVHFDPRLSELGAVFRVQRALREGFEISSRIDNSLKQLTYAISTQVAKPVAASIRQMPGVVKVCLQNASGSCFRPPVEEPPSEMDEIADKGVMNLFPTEDLPDYQWRTLFLIHFNQVRYRVKAATLSTDREQVFDLCMDDIPKILPGQQTLQPKSTAEFIVQYKHAIQALEALLASRCASELISIEYLGLSNFRPRCPMKDYD